MCAGVSLEVECVVEALAADRTQIALHVVVATEMTRQQPLQRKHLAAHSALKLVVGRLQHCNSVHPTA